MNGEYTNVLLTELPNGDFAHTIFRQFLFDAWHLPFLKELSKSPDVRLSGIAEKAVKEATYHLKWSSEWVLRLGDGTPESHLRMLAAVEELWMYREELLMAADFESELIEAGVIPAPDVLRQTWSDTLANVLHEAGLSIPQSDVRQKGGKNRYPYRTFGTFIDRIAICATRLAWSGMVASTMNNITKEDVYKLLEWVVDPEIPVLTVFDLGIIRDVNILETGVEVVITPTYSGCPAMFMIEAQIKAALIEGGIRDVTIRTVLSPAWTTDWITEEGRAKLEKFGIAAPRERDHNPILSALRFIQYNLAFPIWEYGVQSAMAMPRL
jgi:phenylacetate-CoA oxygenase PaaJ subunit